jgi:drug/metabolite transporter (DMT)-like permease
MILNFAQHFLIHEPVLFMHRLAPFLVIIAASLWALDGIVLRPSLYSLPVVIVVLIESALVAFLLTPFFIRQFGSLKKLERWDWFAFIGVALFGGAIGTMAITKALFYVNFVNFSVVILIQKLQPVFAISLAAIMLKEKLPKEFFLWSVIAVIGAYFMTFGENIPDFNSGDKTTTAALFSLIAAISFSSSTVLSKRALKNVEYRMGTYLRFLFTSVIMLIVVLFMGEFNKIGNVSVNQLYIFLIIAFSTGGAAIFLYYYGLKKITASVSAICELSFPLTAVILEYFIHGNVLGFVQWIGTAVLLASILRITFLKQ